jgi:amino acid transporter
MVCNGHCWQRHIIVLSLHGRHLCTERSHLVVSCRSSINRCLAFVFFQRLAGQYSFISLYIVAFVLYLFRNIYAEVGLALPLNGGAYNVLLNCTSKLLASIAACLTLVSYIATAVVSASSAIAYGQNLWPDLNPAWAVIALLGFFCLLTLFGLKESSNVALVIFIVHIMSMSILVVMCLKTVVSSHHSIELFRRNWSTKPLESVPIDIFYGFALALLGVSGFETSSNYIEEQKADVFPKTLRNMWYVVSLFNPCEFIVPV